MNEIIIGITGASGSIIADTIIKELLSQSYFVHLIVTDTGKQVLEYELDINFEDLIASYKNINTDIKLYANNYMFCKIASGSYKTKGMIIVPCSMGTLGKISCGIADSLLNRVADVMIKEKNKLLLVTRETPLNSIHLENMLKLSRLGVTIFPPVPAYYNKPKTLKEIIDITAGRILNTFEIKNTLHHIWQDGDI